ncbi:phospho-sugar mutase [Bacillus sp. AGMB 02131]|uniref:Phosphoglucomutase n=1 Tax=Peribacillus faecalis TaxID=2772559 RepID=A0A927CX78_9BACI|nr:phospho-sugar mutase [Peribacillus faecalis]MBD3107620.1 phospho-sugar mutase [Peribacillus faecalis]
MAWKVKANNWQQSAVLEKELKEQLEQHATDEKVLEDMFYRNLEFGTAGMRGEIGPGTNRMNIYTVRKAAEGLAHYMNEQGQAVKERGVAIAYDSRHKSAEFALEVAKTLGNHGIRSYLFDELRPTPELSFAVRYLEAFAGVMITASHNPSIYNGFKLYGEDGSQITPDAAEQIIHNINQIDDELQIPVMEEELLIQQGLLIYVGETIDEAYLSQLQNISLQNKKMEDIKIVYSPLHGTGNKLVQEGLKRLGFENVTVVQEQELPDPDFSTVKSPNPEEHDAFKLAISYGEKMDADLLLATDPDADRLGVAVRNKEGNYTILTGNQIGAILIHYLIKQKKEQGTLAENSMVLKSIVTSEMGVEIAKSFGVYAEDTLTGFKYIAEKIEECCQKQENEFLFGYEESYGFLIRDFVRDKDAIQAAVMVAEVTAFYKEKGMSLYDGLLSLYDQFGYFQESIKSLTLKGKEGAALIEAMMNEFRQQVPTEIAGVKVVAVEDYQSGERCDLIAKEKTKLVLPKSNVLKFYCENGSWFCLRPSGTEPKMKFYFAVCGESQADSQQLLQELETDVMQRVNELVK